MQEARPEVLLEFLAPYPPEVQELTLAARIRLLEILPPDPCDIFWDATQAVCVGFTYTGNTTHNVVNLAVYANHVSLIFPWGVKLRDPEGRLRGEGNQVRNIRVPTLEALSDPYIAELIQQAVDIAVMPEHPVPAEPIVKVMKGPKRRPKPATRE
ncbi:MAG: DUF1801 domain-containing protein [Armatimonadetes bacterium]|nr:DUF1801 domain-containing protein [Armatimonadota bacterium]